MDSTPDFVSARVNHAVTQAEPGELDPAMAEFESLVGTGVESPVIHNAMARVFLRRGTEEDLALAETLWSKHER